MRTPDTSRSLITIIRHSRRLPTMPRFGRSHSMEWHRWQQQVPLFARQFAWRPADQPWRRLSPGGSGAALSQRSAPQMVGFRPAQPGYAPAVGSWHRRRAMRQITPGIGRLSLRPAAPPTCGLRRRLPGQSRQSVSPIRAYVATGRGIGGLKQPPLRPGATTMPSGRPPMVVVWPAAREAPARHPENFGFTQDHLPGWVTTYQESQFSGSCSWCSGS